MNQKTLINTLFILVVVLIAGVVYLTFFNKPVVSPGEPVATDFNLIFKYGVGAINELNTFDQTYTKDMIGDPSVTIEFKLTNNELIGIYQKINDLKLFDENGKPAGGSGIITPCSSYYLKAQINSTQKELSWDNCSGKISSDKLQQFTDYIISIIEAKEEYKKLPTPKYGYD